MNQVREQDIRSDIMKKKKKSLLEKLKEFDTYDRVYFEGRLSSALIVILSFIVIICTILLIVIF